MKTRHAGFASQPARASIHFQPTPVDVITMPRRPLPDDAVGSRKKQRIHHPDS